MCKSLRLLHVCGFPEFSQQVAVLLTPQNQEAYPGFHKSTAPSSTTSFISLLHYNNIT